MPDSNNTFDTLLTNDPDELFAQECKAIDRWFRSEIGSMLLRLSKKEIDAKQVRYETEILRSKYKDLMFELKKRFSMV